MVFSRQSTLKCREIIKLQTRHRGSFTSSFGSKINKNAKAAAAVADFSTGSESAFVTEKEGLGSATIHGNYDRLSIEAEVPNFLDMPKTIGIIGAPMSWGQPRAGTDQGSQILRDCGLVATLSSLGWRIDDQGDLEFEGPSRNDTSMIDVGLKGNAKNVQCVGKGLKKIHDKVYQSAKNGEFSLILGGDHSISAGSVSAILKSRPDTGIIWVDAHADLNTPETSPSGNIHGMPIGMMMGLYDAGSVPGWEWLEDLPPLKPEQIVYVGLRDVDSREREFIKDLHIKSFTMFDVDKYGIGQTMNMALEHLKGRPLHMSFDIDAVDPEFAPSTGTVVRGGLTYREAHFVAEAVARTGKLGSMDLVEVNPKLTPGDESRQTAELGMALIASALGSSIL